MNFADSPNALPFALKQLSWLTVSLFSWSFLHRFAQVFPRVLPDGVSSFGFRFKSSHLPFLLLPPHSWFWLERRCSQCPQSEQSFRQRKQMLLLDFFFTWILNSPDPKEKKEGFIGLSSSYTKYVSSTVSWENVASKRNIGYHHSWLGKKAFMLSVTMLEHSFCQLHVDIPMNCLNFCRAPTGPALTRQSCPCCCWDS